MLAPREVHGRQWQVEVKGAGWVRNKVRDYLRWQGKGVAKGENRYARELVKGEPAFSLPLIIPSLLLLICKAMSLLGEVQGQLDSKVLERELPTLLACLPKRQEEKL
jgi:hypothetical protein